MKTTEFRETFTALRTAQGADWTAWEDELETHKTYGAGHVYLISRNSSHEARLFYTYQDLEEFMVFNNLLEGPYGSSDLGKNLDP